MQDMHSYQREISCGLASHNIITPIMKDYNLDLQGALDWLGTYTDGVVSKFLSDLSNVPSFNNEDLEERVWTYVDGLGQWVRGNDDWSYEAKRYHGDDGLVVKETRMISIKPRWGNYLRLQEEVVAEEEVVEVVSKAPVETSHPSRDEQEGRLPVSEPCSEFSSPMLSLPDFVLRMEVRTWWSWVVDGVMVKSALMQLPPWKLQN